jgi:hypothetical protein
MTNATENKSADDCPFEGEVPAAPRKVPVPPPEPEPEPQSDLQRICQTPLESLSFKDYLKLKSGRDRFSKISLAELQSAVSETDWIAVTSAFADEKVQASCCRWILRGLDVEKAIRKVRADLEIAEKAISKRRS